MSLKLGYKQTEIGVIPEDWETRRIDSFTSCTSGGTPSTLVAEYWGGPIRWMSSGELNLKRVREVDGRITEAGLHNSSTKMVPAKCVLIGLAGQGKTRGTAAMNFVQLCTNQSIAAILPSKSHDSAFLYYVIDTKYEELRGLSDGGGGRGGLNLSIIKAIQVTLPGINEQEAIAEALSDFDALIDSLEALLIKKRNIKTGVMQELLTGRTRLPGFTADWQEVRLGAICDFVPTIALSRAQLEADEGVMCIHYGDIHTKFSDRLDIANAMLPKSETLLVARVPRLKVGDLVLADASEDLVGVGKSVEIVSVGSVEVVGGLHTVVLRPKVGNFAPGFAGLLQHTPRFKEQSRVLAAGLKVYGLSKTSISKILVFVPPVKEQKAIAAVLSDIDDEIEALEKRLAKTRDLKQGMAQELLTGRTRLV